jgi:hypothetical protein
MQLRLVSLALLAVPFVCVGQTAVVSGNLFGFDVLNDTGQPAHGFEIQMEGALPTDLYYTFPGGRYGSPTIVPYSTGVYVRWTASYSAGTGTYTAATPPATAQTFGWQDCYQGGAGYPTSGCEHLGQGMRSTPPNLVVTGRWLVDDSANPGQLIAVDPPASIPFPVWSVAAPTTSAPVVVVKVPAPPPAPAQYGEAFWMKVFKTDQSRSVDGDELLSTNPSVVPEDTTQVETPWKLLQSPPPGANGKHGSHSAQSSLAIVTGAVVRRFELYKYTGTYDSLTHEALCADLVCNTPAAGELGGAISAQNSASNVVADSLSVAKSGSAASGAGVSGGSISCGSACAAFGTNGAGFTLTANPGSAIFAGWSGACSGTQLTCSGTVNGRVTVGAAFLLQYTLSVGHSNPGTVSATPNGNDRTLNCGSSCSAKFTDGTVVTLTATPPSGKQFVNWSGACSGTSPTCSVTIAKDTSVQAVFSK